MQTNTQSQNDEDSWNDCKEQWTPLLDENANYEALLNLKLYPLMDRQLLAYDSPVEISMPVHLFGCENATEWLVERVRRELVLSKARNAMIGQRKVRRSRTKQSA